ncbi:hypothetical protein ACUN24_04055 [Pedobacter sp. WC2501]|uniref:hypothetical protein n=1 Tax=Pedobacter sp. WC2501 TaxID=3461400 RepID=UPI00404584C8
MSRNQYITRLLVISLFILTHNLTYAQRDKPFKNDWARDELRGKVKQIDHYIDKKLQKRITYNLSGLQTKYQSYSQSMPQKIFSSYESFYDTKGNLIKNIGGDFTTINKYDELGNLIENRVLLTGNQKTRSLQTFKYANRNIIYSKQTNFLYNSIEIDFINEIEYLYNEKKLLIEEIVTFTRANKLLLNEKILYGYDNLNRRSSKTKFNGRGDTTQKFEYDSVGRTILMGSRFPNKIQQTSSSDYNEYYKYDKNGNRVEISNFSTKGIPIYKGEYKFDVSGNCINHAHYMKNQLTGETAYLYNSNGWLTEEIRYTYGELKEKILYTRDNHGNIIKRIHFDGKQKQTLLLEYRIIYY